MLIVVLPLALCVAAVEWLIPEKPFLKRALRLVS